jgi:hypothetical protein
VPHEPVPQLEVEGWMLIGRLKPSTIDTAACERVRRVRWVHDRGCDAAGQGGRTQ